MIEVRGQGRGQGRGLGRGLAALGMLLVAVFLAPPLAARAPEAISRDNVLALSWQASFCADRPRLPECRGPAPTARLTLHGLWPQPHGRFFCIADPAERARIADLDRAPFTRLPPVPGLTPPVAQRLAAIMPGLQSGLERHEWWKHGTCFGTDADAYFRRAMALSAAVLDSAIGRLLAGRIGQRVTLAEIRDAADQSFGPSAGLRVSMVCGRGDAGRAVAELRLHLYGEIDAEARLADLLRAARPVTDDRACRSGILTP